MALDPAVLKARVDSRVCELKLLATLSLMPFAQSEVHLAVHLRLDKSVALRRIEPLHSAARQFDLPSAGKGHINGRVTVTLAKCAG